MKRALGFLAVLILTTISVAQSSSPAISQFIAFRCKNFTSCPNGFDPTLPPIQLSDGNSSFFAITLGGGSITSGAFNCNPPVASRKG